MGGTIVQLERRLRVRNLESRVISDQMMGDLSLEWLGDWKYLHVTPYIGTPAERLRRPALHQQNMANLDSSHGLRDPKSHSNMDQASNTLRTVAHNPLVRLRTAANPTSTPLHNLAR